jgi:hypothetical protein
VARENFRRRNGDNFRGQALHAGKITDGAGSLQCCKRQFFVENLRNEILNGFNDCTEEFLPEDSAKKNQKAVDKNHGQQIITTI